MTLSCYRVFRTETLRRIDEYARTLHFDMTDPAAFYKALALVETPAFEALHAAFLTVDLTAPA